jgi:enterochelin esterase-like enzyme
MGHEMLRAFGVVSNQNSEFESIPYSLFPAPSLLESETMTIARRLLTVVFLAVIAFAQTPPQQASPSPSSAAAHQPSEGTPQPSARPAHVVFRVTLSPQAASKTTSGRLLLLVTSNPKPVNHIEFGFGNLDANDVWIAAKEISSLTAGASVDINPDELIYPSTLSKAPAGEYQLQAVLDTNHDYAYANEPDGGDMTSDVVRTKLPATEPVALTLTRTLPEQPLPQPPHAKLIDFPSKRLSAYWGRPMHIRGWLVLPPSYEKNETRRYPTVYQTHGFGGNLRGITGLAEEAHKRMESKSGPEMIYVVLDESCPRGTHEFADSANNGPWGDALTKELIPDLEKKYRMDAKPSGRFVTGHSSGGWAALWLQVAYPAVFGGSWPTAPDPSDFHSFTGVDLLKDTNFYHKPDGSPRMLVRMGGKDIMSLEQFAKMERVMGDYGGQMASFEYVFSPRGEDGRPMQLFNRDTGEIDRKVADAWEKYDVAKILRDHWKQIGPQLNGKIHLTVGTADTFHLDEPAHALEATLKQLGAKADFTYIPGRTHMDLYKGGLEERIAKEMYAVARPAKKKAAAAATAGAH